MVSFFLSFYSFKAIEWSGQNSHSFLLFICHRLIVASGWKGFNPTTRYGISRYGDYSRTQNRRAESKYFNALK